MGCCSSTNASKAKNSAFGDAPAAFSVEQAPHRILFLGLRGAGKSFVVQALLSQGRLGRVQQGVALKGKAVKPEDVAVFVCPPTQKVEQHRTQFGWCAEAGAGAWLHAAASSSKSNSGPEAILIDTPGNARDRVKALDLISHATVVVYVISLEDHLSWGQSREELEAVTRKIKRTGLNLEAKASSVGQAGAGEEGNSPSKSLSTASLVVCFVKSQSQSGDDAPKSFKAALVSFGLTIGGDADAVSVATVAATSSDKCSSANSGSGSSGGGDPVAVLLCDAAAPASVTRLAAAICGPAD